MGPILRKWGYKYNVTLANLHLVLDSINEDGYEIFQVIKEGPGLDSTYMIIYYNSP